MTKILIILLTLIFCTNSAFASVKIPIEITKIYDGDTVLAKIDEVILKGQKSKQYLEKLNQKLLNSGGCREYIYKK